VYAGILFIFPFTYFTKHCQTRHIKLFYAVIIYLFKFLLFIKSQNIIFYEVTILFLCCFMGLFAFSQFKTFYIVKLQKSV